MAVDPTYPLYPILCIISAFFMFLVLSHSFIRQSWNLAVTLLCIGLFFSNLGYGIDGIVWRDNADIVVPVYCDIVSRLQFLMNFLPSITSLLITRKLYIIAIFRDIEPSGRKTARIDFWIEWGWGLVYPLFMTVMIYTLCQDTRFIVVQGFGCASSTSDSWFSIIAILVLPLIPPLIAILYCPLIIRTFYIQSTNEFLQSNGSISRTSYRRVMALGCFNIVITLPISIINLASFFATVPSPSHLPPYIGWDDNHASFAPFGISYADVTDTPWHSFTAYFAHGQSILLAVTIFALFGMTPKARSAYWSRIRLIGRLLGCKSLVRERQSFTLDSIPIAFAVLEQPVALPGGFVYVTDGYAIANQMFSSTASVAFSYPSETKFDSDSGPSPSFETTKPL
ncbi:pheromone A receptor-domain-containing protein [Mycena sanguinolenta]|nr:pheromone A receptor-domain-containing protein [Mycena sanguinolenta]